MTQLLLIPEPTKEEMIEEMLELWIDYLRIEKNTPVASPKAKEAHRRYYRYMYQIKDRYGLPYYELRQYLRDAEKQQSN